MAAGAPTYYNVAAATAKGLELSVMVRPSARLSVTAGYPFLKTEVTDPGFSSGDGDVFVRGSELIRRPARQAHLGAGWLLLSRGRLSAEVAFVGARTDVDFGPFPSVRKRLPGYALVDLGADVDVLRRGVGGRAPAVAVTLRAENALNESYETVIGFPGRGRTLLAGIRSHW